MIHTPKSNGCKKLNGSNLFSIILRFLPTIIIDASYHDSGKFIPNERREVDHVHQFTLISYVIVVQSNKSVNVLSSCSGGYNKPNVLRH